MPPKPACRFPSISSPVEALLRLIGISKRFPGATALDDVGLVLEAGAVRALIGENGSGKSTLARIACGALAPDAGRIEVDGVERAFGSPREALDLGIVAITQQLSLAPTLSVAENIFIGRLPRGRLGRVDWGKLRTDAREVLAGLDVHVDERRAVGELSVELQQEIAIARALSSPLRLLVLDEATSALSDAATRRLFEIVARLRSSGAAVLMITHRLSELYGVAGAATVLRDGRVVADVPLPSTPERELMRLMVGRELPGHHPDRAIEPRETVLAVDGLHTLDGRLRPTTLCVRGGEILGVTGLEGSGKAELGLALAGAIPSEGCARVLGRAADLSRPRAALASGIGFVPDDRHRAALLPTRSVAENFSVAWTRELTHGGVVDTRAERRRVRAAIERYRVTTASPQTRITALSGGNQQKVILGRVLDRDIRVLVLAEPTRGIDVAAKREIYRLLQEQAARGAAVVVISSELPELVRIADRILVLYRGEVRGEFAGPGAEEEQLARVAASGEPVRPAA
jgi:ABC-type sugar transport system ATPase subunit